MVVGALAVATAILALAALDRRSRGAGRLLDWRPPRAWWRRVGLVTWFTDAVVIATLLLWHVIGATSSDDGYNLTIARVTPKAGYVVDYYRYFGTSDAPFDWYLRVLSRLASGQHRRRLDADTGHAGGDRVLADHRALGAAPAGAGPGRPG